ncbi:MAG: hypothetical protein AAGA57_03775 [Planctomycetota bacterium]
MTRATNRPMLQLFDLPPKLLAAVEAELEPEETVLWFAQPSPGRMVKKALPVLVFAIPWTACAVFFTTAALGMHGHLQKSPPAWTAIIGGIFLLFGLLMFFAPYGAYQLAKKSGYVITDRRALLIEAGATLRVRTFGPEKLDETERKQRDDGSGDLILDRETYTGPKGQTRTREVGFYGVPDVREVEAILRDVVEAHRAGA